jgi:hypothetical protein
MSNPQAARDKYARKTQNARASYDAAKGRMKANYAAGMARFLGGPVASHIAASYSAGIDAAQYQPGDPDKWLNNYLAKMRGG